MSTASPVIEHEITAEKIARLDPKRVLFIGLGQSAVGWYRCYLPAMFMGADWIGVAGEPPKLFFLTGMVKGATQMADLSEYDVIVMQQPRGTKWLKLIRDLQDAGKKVVFEVDDYLHGIRKMEDHDFRGGFGRDDLQKLEMNMRVADALIVSTEYIGKRYRSFNSSVYVCENGVDVGRYRLTRPKRDAVNVGWAGATGHAKTVMPWLNQVAWVMTQHAHVNFVSVGQEFARLFHEHFPENRSIAIPWTMIDTYPSAMTMFDIALGPAGRNTFFRGKSDLRWLEAGALGIPIIADPAVYPKIEDRVTGFHAADPVQMTEVLMELVGDEKLRLEVGENAREYVIEKRDMRVAVRQWEWALSEILAAGE